MAISPMPTQSEAAANLPTQPRETEVQLINSELDEQGDVDTSDVDDGADEHAVYEETPIELLSR